MQLRILRNVLHTIIKDMFLVYGGDEELIIKGYADASFNRDLII
jgi:hypothetical protein